MSAESHVFINLQKTIPLGNYITIQYLWIIDREDLTLNGIMIIDTHIGFNIKGCGVLYDFSLKAEAPYAALKSLEWGYLSFMWEEKKWRRVSAWLSLTNP